MDDERVVEEIVTDFFLNTYVDCVRRSVSLCNKLQWFVPR